MKRSERLTMSGNSTIDFSNHSAVQTLSFNGSSYNSGLLTMLNWDGNYGGGANTHLLFTSMRPTQAS